MRKLIVTYFIWLNVGVVIGQENSQPLIISHLTGDFYIYTTFSDYKGIKIPANGMYVVTVDGVILIDTPWDSTQFQPLLDSILLKHQRKVKFCISTHFHEDRTGGLEYYKQQGIKTYTTQLTDQLSSTHAMKRAEFLIEKDTTIQIGQYALSTYHPGHGHTEDNIVIWFAKERILYGGCLIKSLEDNSLGNLEDADINAYAQTVSNVKRLCKYPLFVIPGHNDWSNTKSLQHTLKMARYLKHNNSKK